MMFCERFWLLKHIQLTVEDANSQTIRCKAEAEQVQAEADEGEEKKNEEAFALVAVARTKVEHAHLPCVSVDWVNQPNFPFFFSVRSASVTPWC